jgi:hypothetical protein
MTAGTSTVPFSFTPTVLGTHTVSATDGTASASLDLSVVNEQSPVVCTQSQSGGSSSADLFTVTLCPSTGATNNVAVNDIELVTVALQPSNGSNINGSITMTPPAGWTFLGTQAQGPVQSWVFYRRHQAGDPRSVSFTSSSKNKWVVDMITYRSTSGTAPQLVTVAATGSSVTAPVIPNGASDAIVYYNIASNNATVKYTVPAGITQRTSNATGGSANSMFGYDIFAAASATVSAQTFATVGGVSVNSVLLAVLFDR